MPLLIVFAFLIFNTLAWKNLTPDQLYILYPTLYLGFISLVLYSSMRGDRVTWAEVAGKWKSAWEDHSFRLVVALTVVLVIGAFSQSVYEYSPEYANRDVEPGKGEWSFVTVWFAATFFSAGALEALGLSLHYLIWDIKRWLVRKKLRRPGWDD